MPGITKFVRLTTSPDRLPALRKILEGLAAASRREDGCVLYDVHHDGAGTCCIVEVWRDEDALQAHVTLPHTTGAITAFSPLLIEEPQAEDFHPASVAAIAD